MNLPEDRPFIKRSSSWASEVLFISISSTVTSASLRGVIWPALALVALLVLVIRPAVAMVATAPSSLTRNERIFIGSIGPRGIVADEPTCSPSVTSCPSFHLGENDGQVVTGHLRPRNRQVRASPRRAAQPGVRRLRWAPNGIVWLGSGGWRTGCGGPATGICGDRM